MIEKLKAYFSKVRFLWLLCLIFNIITFFLIYFKIHPSNQTLALRYSILAGVEWYGQGKHLYFIPGVGLAILGLNFGLYKAIKNHVDFLSSLLAFVSLCVQIILLAAVLLLARVN